jgi:hypothetical protein
MFPVLVEVSVASRVKATDEWPARGGRARATLLRHRRRRRGACGLGALAGSLRSRTSSPEQTVVLKRRTGSSARGAVRLSKLGLPVRTDGLYGTTSVKLAALERSNDPSSPSKVKKANQPAGQPILAERHSTSNASHNEVDQSIETTGMALLTLNVASFGSTQYRPVEGVEEGEGDPPIDAAERNRRSSTDCGELNPKLLRESELTIKHFSSRCEVTTDSPVSARRRALPLPAVHLSTRERARGSYNQSTG